MPKFVYRLDDVELELAHAIQVKYGIRVSPIEAKILRLLVALRVLSFDRMYNELWEDMDPFDHDLCNTRTVHICNIRRKLGSLVDISTFHGNGYALNRLGPPDNPMHERK